MTSHDDRLAAHDAVSSLLGAMSDTDLSALLDHHADRRVGIGGATRTIRVAGRSVFVKLVRVTDRERAGGPTCTRNLFGLPTSYQYGVGEGSTGFNAWREVAAHRAASDWVVAGDCGNFPLLHHWRRLPLRTTGAPASDPAAVARAVRFWGGSPAVEARLRALADATTVVALFLEHVPFVLRVWLTDQLRAGNTQAEQAVDLVDQQLLGAVVHLRSQGMSHFDAHFDNVLTDGRRIHLTDFGLATSREFQLDGAEREFFALTCDHDLAYCATALVNAVAGTALGLRGPRERNDYVRRCSIDGTAAGLTGSVADTVARYAGVATVVNDFYRQRHGGDHDVAYPSDAIVASLDRAGLPV